MDYFLKPRKAFSHMVSHGNPFGDMSQTRIPLPDNDLRFDLEQMPHSGQTFSFLSVCRNVITALKNENAFSGPHDGSASRKYWDIEAEDWYRSLWVVRYYFRYA